MVGNPNGMAVSWFTWMNTSQSLVEYGVSSGEYTNYATGEQLNYLAKWVVYCSFVCYSRIRIYCILTWHCQTTELATITMLCWVDWMLTPSTTIELGTTSLGATNLPSQHHQARQENSQLDSMEIWESCLAKTRSGFCRNCFHDSKEWHWIYSQKHAPNVHERTARLDLSRRRYKLCGWLCWK